MLQKSNALHTFFYAKKQHNKRMFLKNSKNMRDRKFGI